MKADRNTSTRSYLPGVRMRVRAEYNPCGIDDFPRRRDGRPIDHKGSPCCNSLTIRVGHAERTVGAHVHYTGFRS